MVSNEILVIPQQYLVLYIHIFNLEIGNVSPKCSQNWSQYVLHFSLMNQFFRVRLQLEKNSVRGTFWIKFWKKQNKKINITKNIVLKNTAKQIRDRFILFPITHSSLVDNLAQVIYAKNCPTFLYCISHLLWVPMTTTQNIRVCFRTLYKTFFQKGPPFG